MCVLLAIVGCRPRYILSNKEMRDVLYDLHRMDGALQVAGYTNGHTQTSYMTVVHDDDELALDYNFTELYTTSYTTTGTIYTL